MIDETPEGLRVLTNAVLLSLLVAVVEEGAEQAGVEVVENESEKVFVKLKRVGKLVRHLPHAVDELQEDGGPVVVVVFVLTVADPVSELVPEAEPLLLDENLKKEKNISKRITK